MSLGEAKLIAQILKEIKKDEKQPIDEAELSQDIVDEDDSNLLQFFDTTPDNENIYKEGKEVKKLDLGSDATLTDSIMQGHPFLVSVAALAFVFFLLLFFYCMSVAAKIC